MSDLGNKLLMEAIRKNLPEVNQRRTAQARTANVEDYFKELQKREGQGNYNPPSRGSWYDVVRERIPDYEKYGNQAVGAIGQWFAGREADKQKVDLDNMVGTESVNALQQIGGGDQDGEATSQALRGYLGLMGGPVGKDMISKAPIVSSTKIDKDGKVFMVMSDGTSVDTGRTADYHSRIMEDGQGGLISVGTGGAGRGQGTTVGYGQQPAQAEQPMVSGVDANGQPASFGADIPENIRNAILQNPDDVAVDGGEQYVQQFGQPPAGAAAQPSGPVRVASPAERAAAKAAATAQAENQNAALIADTAAQKQLAQEQAKNTAEAQNNLGKVKSTVGNVQRAIASLRGAPGLDKIVGGSVYSRIPDSIAGQVVPLISGGGDAADALAMHQNLAGSNFLQAFEQLKGGGQITEKEGEKAEAAFGRLQRSQSKKQYLEALDTLEGVMNELLSNAEIKASGGASRSSAPAAPQGQFKLPAGWSVKVKN